MVTAIRRVECACSTVSRLRVCVVVSVSLTAAAGDVKDKQLNQNFSALFHSLFSSLLFKFRDVTPVCICSLRVDIQIPDEESVELIMNAVAVLLHKPPPGKRLHKKASTRELAKSEDDTQFSMDVDPKKCTRPCLCGSVCVCAPVWRRVVCVLTPPPPADTSLPLSLSSSLQPELEPMRPRAIIGTSLSSEHRALQALDRVHSLRDAARPHCPPPQS